MSKPFIRPPSHNEGLRRAQITMTQIQYDRVAEVADKRHRSVADTMRLLILIGLEQYHLCAECGIKTGKARAEFMEQVRHIADQIKEENEARRQSRKKGKKQKAQAPAILLIGGADGE